MDYLGAAGQVSEWRKVATDPAPRVKTGWPKVDAMLHRGGLSPGTFCILGGRLHTRKTAVALNMAHQMLQAGVPVGFVGLDEAPAMYTAKLWSVVKRQSHSTLEDLLKDPAYAAGVEAQYAQTMKNLSLWRRPRPSLNDLAAWLDVCDGLGQKPRVVFIDYLALLKRGDYDGQDTRRIPRLAEELNVWTKENEVVTIVLHQVGRATDGLKREHGDTPVTTDQLMYGGEQQCDIVWATYRPALDPIGNMTRDQALAEGVDADVWREHDNRVQANKDVTYLQLIKNRPGTFLDPVGVRLRSVADSQTMEVDP